MTMLSFLTYTSKSDSSSSSLHPHNSDFLQKLSRCRIDFTQKLTGVSCMQFETAETALSYIPS